MIQAMQKNGLTLALAALLSTALIAITHTLTAPTIEKKAKAQRLALLNQVIPKSFYNNAIATSCTLIDGAALSSKTPLPAFIAKKDGKATAIAIETIAPDGYNGIIKLLVGVGMEQNVLGVRVLAHNETPGLGDKIELDVSDWILSLSDKYVESEKDPRWTVKKEGGQFDQFTGATLTPKAVIKAAHQAAWFVSQNKTAILNQPFNCEETS